LELGFDIRNRITNDMQKHFMLYISCQVINSVWKKSRKGKFKEESWCDKLENRHKVCKEYKSTIKNLTSFLKPKQLHITTNILMFVWLRYQHHSLKVLSACVFQRSVSLIRCALYVFWRSSLLTRCTVELWLYIQVYSDSP
jgi:hypothetical protein